jgi:hypothetical protein
MKTSPASDSSTHVPTMAILGKRDIELGPFALGETQQEPGPWENWRLRNDEDGIAWLPQRFSSYPLLPPKSGPHVRAAVGVRWTIWRIP